MYFGHRSLTYGLLSQRKQDENPRIRDKDAIYDKDDRKSIHEWLLLYVHVVIYLQHVQLTRYIARLSRIFANFAYD